MVDKNLIRKIELLFNIALVAVGFVIYYLNPAIAGFIVKDASYKDNLNLVVASSGNYTWQPKNAGALKSLRLDGSMSKYGKARVYLETNGARYLVFDSSNLNSGSTSIDNTSESPITGFAVEENDENKTESNEGKNQDATINETKDMNATINETINKNNESITKMININLSYKSGTIYDTDDNGYETINGVVDLVVENSGFSWDAKQSKLCTKWEIYNVETGISTALCNGNNDCCAFAGVLPTKNNWSEAYYSVFGKDGAGHDNIISSLIIYYDVNLSPDNIKSEIYNSDWSNLSVKFFEGENHFNYTCMETCSLNGLNKSAYTLIFEIEDNAVLRIDAIDYKILTDVKNNPPLLLKNFSTVNIVKNKNATLNLSEYFWDNDGDLLTYDYYKAEGITMLFEDSTLTIMPNEGFEGATLMYISANDSQSAAVSNLFAINVSGYEYNSSAVNITATNTFEIRDRLDNKLAVFDSLGNLNIKGLLSQNAEITADENDFAIQNLSGGFNAVITNPQGDLIIKGILSENQSNLIPTPNSFVVQNKDNESVAYFNSMGSLFLKGILNQKFIFKT